MFDLAFRRMAVVALCATLAACSSPELPEGGAASAGGSAYRLYLLAGQSNMEGYGDVAALSPHERGPVPGAVIYAPASLPDGADSAPSAEWRPLAPGFGSAYPPDGVTEGQFGPELSLGRALAASGPAALVKYARGGTALTHGVSGYGSWDPEHASVTQLDHAVAALDAALRASDPDGVPDRLVPSGIAWMQGEADAYDSAEAVAAYEAKLTAVIAALRGAMGSERLPFVMGRIVNSRPPGGAPVMAYAAEIQAAQARVADADPCVTLVTALPAAAELSDGWHYGAADQLRLGRAFAEALDALAAPCGVPKPAAR